MAHQSSLTKDYQDTGLKPAVIPSYHQAITPAAYLNAMVTPPSGELPAQLMIIWRPSPAVETTGCYSLVGSRSNRFTAVPLDDGAAVITPKGYSSNREM